MNETAQQLPRFAVVGHPNKGKSSVVATLAQNDSIAIAMEPGTTRDSHRYPMKVDDTTLYELIDTPGFQRPRKVLAWLQVWSGRWRILVSMAAISRCWLASLLRWAAC